MRALVHDSYGPASVVSLAAVPDPAPGPREVVVEVRATTINSGDARLRAADFPPGMGLLGRLATGWSRPRQRVLGVELAGVVHEVGAEVTEYAPGDRVLGMTGTSLGAHAERCTVAVDHCLVPLPPDVPFTEAVTLPFGGTTALTFLEAKLAVQPGDRLLVIGASGAVGAAAVQIGRLLGARVTGVCSGGRADLVRSLGAERVIDYTTTDVFAGEERWSVVVDTVGKAPVTHLRQVTEPRGRIGLVAAGIPQMAAGLWTTLTSRQRCAFGVADESPAYLERLVQWLRAGDYAPVIDCVLPWERGAEGHARVDSHHKRGSVVLTLEAARASLDPVAPSGTMAG